MSQALADRTVYRVEGWALSHLGSIDHLMNMRSWGLPAKSYCGVVCNSQAARDSVTESHRDILKVTSVRETLCSHLTWTHDAVTQGGFYGCE
jgi:hypothetical protein